MKKFFLALVAMTALTVGTASATPVGTFSFAGGVNTVVAPSSSFTLLSAVLPADTQAFGTIGGGSTGDFALTPPNFMYVHGQAGPGNFVVTEAGVNAGVRFNFGPSFGSTAYYFISTGFAGSTLVSVPNNNVAGATLLGNFYKGSNVEQGTIVFSFQNTVTGVTQPASETTYSADASTVPEPSTYAMLGSALLGLGLLRRRKA
ncbi:MAG: PEP-CTERM sorting domain-containing protein [Acidobacteria bacterium]|nr:PEP-CTERM sorting domain-containing protein [Acidobacteriota bacterium]